MQACLATNRRCSLLRCRRGFRLTVPTVERHDVFACRQAHPKPRSWTGPKRRHLPDRGQARRSIPTAFAQRPPPQPWRRSPPGCSWSRWPRAPSWQQPSAELRPPTSARRRSLAEPDCSGESKKGAASRVWGLDRDLSSSPGLLNQTRHVHLLSRAPRSSRCRAGQLANPAHRGRLPRQFPPA
jgi:hypothetical protein